MLGGATTATVNEGALVTLGATDTAGNVTITGLPHDLSNFNGGSYTATTGSWSGTAPQFNALTFTAGEAGNFTLAIAATTAGAPTTENYALTIQPAAPALGGATTATVTAGALVTLGASDTAAFADDTLGNVTITGLPHDLSNFNGGTYTATTGSWTGTAPQFNALTFTAGAAGTFTLAVAATTVGAAAPTTENYALTIQPAAPVLGGATTATVNEGALVTLGATDTAGNVTITGLPHDLSNFNGGSYTATTGSWSGTAPQFNALTFTAGEAGTFTLAIAATTAAHPPPRTMRSPSSRRRQRSAAPPRQPSRPARSSPSAPPTRRPSLTTRSATSPSPGCRTISAISTAVPTPPPPAAGPAPRRSSMR